MPRPNLRLGPTERDLPEPPLDTTQVLRWSWQGRDIEVGLTRAGSGRPVLLLPAMSSISTRHEMAGLQLRLAAYAATVAVDWPGFGDRTRPKLDWCPELYHAFVRHLLAEITPQPLATLAAGHAAPYAMAADAASPGAAGNLCLLAPTWRGPLPTMMNGRSPLGDRIVWAGDLPVIGAVLYRLNVNRAMVRLMAREHVYADAAWLRDGRARQKASVIAAPGARHASLRFVTGRLDPMATRDEFLDVAQRCRSPILVLYGHATPRRSKAEMEALAARPGIEAIELPFGKLGLHEEFPDALAGSILRFLAL